MSNKRMRLDRRGSSDRSSLLDPLVSHSPIQAVVGAAVTVAEAVVMEAVVFMVVEDFTVAAFMAGATVEVGAVEAATMEAGAAAATAGAGMEAMARLVRRWILRRIGIWPFFCDASLVLRYVLVGRRALLLCRRQFLSVER